MRRKILISAISFIFVFLIFCAIVSCKSADRYYKQGLNFEKQEKYQDAYYNYGKISKFSKIYPLAIYKQAKCAKKIGDNKTAIKKYEKYTSSVKDEIMTPFGLWELGNLYYENNDLQKAEKIFKNLENKYLNNNYTYASYFRLGEIEKDKNKQKAKEYLIKYLEYAPIGRFSKKALQYLEEINEPLSEDEKLIISNSYSQNDDFEKAIQYINSTPQDKRWIQEYKIYKNNKNENRALEIIQYGLALENKEIDENDIKDAVNYYVLKKATKDDIKNLYELTNKKDNKAHIYVALIQAQSADNGYELFSNILKSNSKYSDIALSEMIYENYKKGDYKTAIRLGGEFYSKYKDKNTAPYAIYFLAKSYYKKGDKKQAENLYRKIINDYQRSYYAFRANQALKNKYTFNLQENKNQIKKQDIKYQFEEENSTNFLLNKLIEFDDITTLDDFKIEDEFLKSYIAYKNKKNVYSQLLARDEADKSMKILNKNQTMLVYPVYYEEFINRYSKAADISPYLTIALIRKESHFNESAKSGAGAVGLMQILPDTANFIEKGTLKGNVQSPNYNIFLGTKYYSYLKNMFEGDDMLSIAAYNAGPGNVKKWLNKDIKDYDIFVESIPFVETKSYVKKVFEAYWNYINLY